MEDVELRDANKKLLQRLKQSQVEISRLIVAAKHSDPRLINAAPLTSTVANRNGGDALRKSGRLLTHARNVLTKSPGILKKKTKQQKRVRLPTPLIKSPNPASPSSPKYEIISNFLKHQSDKGKNLTFTETPQGQPMLTDAGNTRPYRATEQMKEPISILVKTGTSKPISERNFDMTQSSVLKTPQRKEIRSEPPLLGYDWIAGNIENDEPGAEQSESFLEEMKEFRKLNRSDCHSKRCWNDILKTPKTPLHELSPQMKLQGQSARSPDPSDTRDSRIVNYTINKRLFPVPVDPNDCGRPGTTSSPRYIRVSIPKASLISPYRYRPKHGSKHHDGADSLALPDHCALGWHNTVPKRVPKSEADTCLDLRSSIRPKENLTSLQLKSGQANLKGGLKTTPASESYLDRSYAIQYNLRKLKSGI
uniref:Migration and invasion-inhibitory protein-like n=1 Tax=Phallusia mammillata TaxID=59560 RepID=A0A6F9DLD6_9ASCI|nr:migration and invasion-inhibitory protein-like [Phallusia mammillata]